MIVCPAAPVTSKTAWDEASLTVMLFTAQGRGRRRRALGASGVPVVLLSRKMLPLPSSAMVLVLPWSIPARLVAVS